MFAWVAEEFEVHRVFQLVVAEPVEAVSLEHGDPMAGAVQLIGDGEAGRSRANDRHAFAGADRRRAGDEPAFVDSTAGVSTSSSKLRSTAGAEWVRAPIET